MPLTSIFPVYPPQSIKTDGFASSGNSTEDEGLLTSQKLTGVSHRRGMSRFYFTSHREGPKPRGRPTFGHKVKVVGERRGRDNSSGRTVARSTVRDNFESHSEREYCFDSEETKMPSHHLQRQSEDLTKNQRRCTYPAKRVAKVEDYTLATTRKAHDSVERTFSPMESDLPGGKVARNNNSRPREAPREKQRLTQDLARQKRLLSEDIARAELLQRDQILKKFTEIHGNGSEGTCAEDESSHDPVLSDSSVSGNAESPSRERNLLDGHDKCPGPFEKCSEEHLSANEQGVLKDQSIHPAPGDKRNEKERESLFEKFSCKGDTRSAEFVSSDNVEVGGENNSLPNCEAIKTLNSSSNSSEGEKVSCGGDLVTGHLEPLEFENVTDDDLDISDVEPQSPLVSGSDKTPVELDLGDPKKQKNEIKKSSLPEMCPDIGTSVMDSAVDCTESPQSETNIFESLSLSPCSCQSELESAERVTTASGCHESSNAPESPGLGNSGKHPDHSNIKMDQVMVQPDMQCEHSTKCESVSEHVIASSVNLECGGPVAEELSNCYDRKDRDAANASPEAARAKEENLENGEPLEWSHSDEEEDNETAKTVANKDRLSPANGEQNDAVLSNNEGMSDAGEMSEPEIAAGVARGKVKTKKRKRSHSVAKLHIRGNHRPRGNRNRRARTLKGSRRNNFKGLESGSDDNEAYVTTADCTARETEVNTKGEGDRAAPSTTCCDTERTEEDEGEEQIEGDAPTEASAEVHEEVEKERVSSSVVDNSDDDVEVHGNGELSKKDRIKRENRLVIKHKRKSEEKDKDRATPPHLVSQNRYARDLPRHNWLVEQLLQQNKLCGDTINNIAIPDKRDTQEKLSESEEIEGEKTEKSEKRSCEVELGSKSDTVGSSGEQNEAQLSPTKDAVHSELHKNFFKRCPQQTVPRAPPKLKPSTETSFDGASPVLKHKLSPRETPILEPLPKLKKIVEGDQSPKQELNAERQGAPTEAESADSEERNSHPELEELKMRKALSPIEILDDDEDKRERALEPGVNLELQSPSAKKAQDDNEEEPSRNNGLPEPSRSKSFSPPRKPAVLSLAKGRGNSVSPKDHLGRSLHTSPHRAAILIPVVPMQDGMHRGLASSSPRLKGFPPRTFTPHLLTHTSPLSASPMFPDALPPGVRYPGNACVHQHMGGGHCKRDINCPFHGNQGRGIPPSPLSISGHRPITGFSQHGHELLSRNHHHDDAKSPCTHAECKTCHFDKDANMALFNDKGPGELPKVVKPIAHVPGKRAPLILPHLPQHGRLSHAPYRGLEELYEESPRGIGAESAGFQSRRKSADKLTTSHSGSDIAPSHMHPPPLTLSELNRRREEENAKAYGEETQVGFQSKLSPQSDLNVPGIAPLSRNVNGRPRSKDGLVLSAGHHGPIVVSRSDQRRSPRPLSLGIGEQAERLDYSSYMAELLKSGPPRLRPVEDPQELTDYKSLVNRHKQEELLVLNSDKPRFAQPMLVKDSSEALTDGKRSARDFDEREKSMRRIPGDGRSPNLRLLGSRGGTGMLEVRPSDSESVGTKDGKQRQHSQEIERGRHKSDTAFNRGFGPRGFELVQSKDQTKRGDSRAGIDTEREFSVSSAQSGSPKEVDPREHSLLPPRISQRFDPRLDSRIAALREMELHRRLENNRLSDFSHREMLSRMALSFSLDKPKPAEQSSHDAALIRHDLRSRVFSNPTTRDYVMPASSRQALDRLAAAAGKPGSLTAESRLKQVCWVCCTYILLTECEGRTGRISARGLGSTDRAASARSVQERPRADILPVRPEQTRSIRDLLHDF